ncbi:LysE family translocator [Acinetobacter sp. MD2(2019)]|uniref:LysE family translocator n=1 Tax=Acinetobacter sp. MD2(2019) TaxID=2605273 RepID=UPI002D1F5D19|nr:LysE family transporter [Acinetobacter sp. MD2(2019)]MEB3754844.1 LysE family transporter [Acinetobacter sp. MD2(2019)]
MISWIFIGLVMAILLTPGPTNTLLASSGIRIGLLQSLKLIPAEAIGYILAISIWGFFVDWIAQSFPLLPMLMKLLSASYIIYLAMKLWKTAQHNIELNSPLIQPKELFAATLLNPKALLFACAVFPANTWLHWSNYLSNMALFLILVLPIALFWIAFGQLLAKSQVQWLTPFHLQRTASVVLMSFSLPMSYAAVVRLW